MAIMLAEHAQAIQLSPGASPAGIWRQEQMHSSNFDFTSASMQLLSPDSRYQHHSTDSLQGDLIHSPSQHTSQNYTDIIGSPSQNSPSHYSELMGGSPLQNSPQHYSDTEFEGCNGWLNLPGFTASGDYAVYSEGTHFNNREQSPDSGIYSSPTASPNSIDLPVSDAIIPTSCTSIHPSHSLSQTLTAPNDLMTTCMQDYSTTSSPLPHQPPQMFPSASSLLFPFPQVPTSMGYNVRYHNEQAMAGYIQELPESLDPVPIIQCDQVTGNPIHFYSECTTDVSPSSFLDSITTPTTSSYQSSTYNFSRPIPAVKPNKRPRKPKPQTQVDPSDIKDIPASAQLWEFLLKVLKKPKYQYMVSWENCKDGLFRFHDPTAFAALWGRHRNRPSMTYDKVARALRYYYKRDILEQVGGRLTYKFSPRLCKQFKEAKISEE